METTKVEKLLSEQVGLTLQYLRSGGEHAVVEALAVLRAQTECIHDALCTGRGTCPVEHADALTGPLRQLIQDSVSNALGSSELH